MFCFFFFFFAGCFFRTFFFFLSAQFGFSLSRSISPPLIPLRNFIAGTPRQRL